MYLKLLCALLLTISAYAASVEGPAAATVQDEKTSCKRAVYTKLPTEEGAVVTQTLEKFLKFGHHGLRKLVLHNIDLNQSDVGRLADFIKDKPLLELYLLNVKMSLRNLETLLNGLPKSVSFLHLANMRPIEGLETVIKPYLETNNNVLGCTVFDTQFSSQQQTALFTLIKATFGNATMTSQHDGLYIHNKTL